MQLKKLHILNFRALADVEVPLSDFGCIIGENNAGKSSVLHALVLVLTGILPRPNPTDSDRTDHRGHW
jgi:predicted ATP-dependent endonuclease of OLD family